MITHASLVMLMAAAAAPQGAPRELPLATLHGPTDRTPAALPRSHGSATEAPGRVTPGTLEVDRSRLHFRAEECGRLWVRGRTYKASADPKGFTFIPFLGSHAPRNFPVHFTLTEASLGGEPLSLDSSAIVGTDGNRVTLDRGAVEVRYDLGLESVEQSFLVDAQGANGPLELILEVQSELACGTQARADHRALEFEGPHGGVRYGAATVYDGSGRSREIPTRLDGTELRLSVPADFVGSTSGPILVDPVISTYGVATALGDQRDVDMAYDLNSDAFLYAFEEEFSGSDVDVIVMQRRATDGAFLGSSYFDLSSNAYKDPSVANLHDADRSLVVAIRTAGATGSTGSLLGAFFDHPSGLGPSFSIDSGGISSKGHPDVGGCGSNDPDAVFMVVWERYFWTIDRTAIVARSVARDGTMGPIEEVAAASSSFQHVEPAVSKSSGHDVAPNSWKCAFASLPLGTGTTGRIQAATLDRDAHVTESTVIGTFDSDETFWSLDVSEEQFAVDGARFAVVAGFRQMGQGYLRLFLSKGPFETDERLLSELEHAGADRNLSEPHLATQDRRFLLTYLERVGNDATAFLTVLDTDRLHFLANAEVRTRLAFLGGVAHEDGGVAIASKYGGGDFQSRLSGLSWETVSGVETDLVGVTHRSPIPRAVGLPYCIGEPNSTGERGRIGILGDLSLTAPKTLFAQSTPPGSLGMFIISESWNYGPGGAAQPGGLCLGSPIGRILASVGTSDTVGMRTHSLDPTQLPLPGGAVPALAGENYLFQYWHRDAIGGVATSNFTNVAQLFFWN